MWWPFTRLNFRKEAEKHFAFLTEEYGFGAPTYIDKEWWQKSLVYKNATTAVIIRDEFYTTPGVFVELARLTDGHLPPVVVFTYLEKSLEQFYLDDLVYLHDSAQGRLPMDKKGLATLAALTRKYASKILRGDFSEFPALEAIVRQRARELGEEQYPKTSRFR